MSNSKNTISIIVPVYNIKNEIQRCVHSIIAQTYKAIEIILVDDGSTDGSYEIIDEIARTDKRIIVIHKNNGGVTSARLEGVINSTGEWIGFVDGDDYIEPNMYEELIKNALDYNADISHCGYQMVFPSRIDYYYNTGKKVEQDNVTGIKDLLTGFFVEPGLWNKLYKKELIVDMINANEMDYSFTNNEDFLMNYYLFKKSQKSIYYDFCPYHYIVRQTSAANTTLNEHQLSDPIEVNEIIYKDLLGNDELKTIAETRLANILIEGATTKRDYNQKFVKEHIVYCRQQIKILNGKKNMNYSKSLKIKLIICSYAPDLYGVIHNVYRHISGLDRKYEIS